MTALSIRVENLFKMYQLGQFSTGTISKDIERWWITKVRGKEDPFIKIGETNDRSAAGGSDVVWSLRDINFDVEQGDAIGIIGKNGAGKSTLLKILSRVTSPTKGTVKLKGRVASLLEVGTGFHPELTGRENVFLNGAILGMRKEEIKRKFDEIVAFSGVERYIDTPVKRYSSGMYVRLAFAVAAHLESEILIVDEVLAVGDSEFQKKCLGKMGEVSKGEGRTILFVSHNLSAVKAFCKKGMVIKDGSIHTFGDLPTAIKAYENDSSFESSSIKKFEPDPDKTIQIMSAMLKDQSGQISNDFNCDESFKVEIKLDVRKEITDIYGVFRITRGSEIVWVSDTFDSGNGLFNRLQTGEHLLRIHMPERTLGVGSYSFNFFLNEVGGAPLDVNDEDFLTFNMSDYKTVRGNTRLGYLSTLPEWELKKEK